LADFKYTWEIYGNPESVAIEHEREEKGCLACAGHTWIKGIRKCKHGIEGYPDHTAESCQWWRMK